MKRLGTIVLSALCWSLLVTLSAPTSSPAAGPPSALDVNVVNTPLPVTGNVGITGTPSVTIGNGVTNPVPVTSTEQRTPYANFDANGNICGYDNQHQCVVPAGKQVVLEHVSGFIFSTPTTDQITAVAIVVSHPLPGLQGGLLHQFLATKTLVAALEDVFTFGSPFKMRLPSGASYYFAGGTISTSPSVSGYMIDVP